LPGACSLLSPLLSPLQLPLPCYADVCKSCPINRRPVSGFVRPGTQATRPMTMDKALKTGRSGTAARPLTNAMGRNLRLGTASMLSDSSATTFINPARIDIAKYAARPALGKALFRSDWHSSRYRVSAPSKSVWCSALTPRLAVGTFCTCQTTRSWHSILLLLRVSRANTQTGGGRR
jgi:hypothetical protein